MPRKAADEAAPGDGGDISGGLFGMPILKTAAADLFYIQRGSGPDVVWVPGGDNVAADWEDQFLAFEGTHRNTSFDPRGAGKTVSHRPPPWSIADFAADCAELIRAVCKPPVIVVGLSMGSLITLQLAIDYPELVRCAIPMGTLARSTGFLRDWMIAEVKFREGGGRLTKEFAVAHYGAFMYPSEVLGDETLWNKVRPFVERSYGEREGEFLAAQWQACIDFDVVDQLPGCRVPIHVIAFSQDMQAPPSHGKLVADLAPEGHFHLLEGLGHLSMAGHRPEQVNDRIRAIVNSFR
jgi:pimeloyl-ACP methyl ester carboxylesterase